MAARPRTFDRDDALGAALDVFWHQGYEATSVQNLVDATGLNRASLYNTFGSKHALYVEALRRYRAEKQGDLLHTLRNADGPALQIIRSVLEDVADEAAACPKKGSCFLTNTATERGPDDTEAAREVRTGFRHFEEVLADVLTRGQDAGTVQSSTTPAAQARFLLTTLQGIRVLSKTCPGREALQDVVDTALHALTPPAN